MTTDQHKDTGELGYACTYTQEKNLQRSVDLSPGLILSLVEAEARSHVKDNTVNQLQI